MSTPAVPSPPEYCPPTPVYRTPTLDDDLPMGTDAETHYLSNLSPVSDSTDRLPYYSPNGTPYATGEPPVTASYDDSGNSIV